MTLAEDIKALALETGFHAVGITGVQPFLESERVLRDRLDGGLLEGSGFSSDAILIRTHPRDRFPQSRSIISVALSYLTEEIGSRNSKPRGSVARFARGIDYHTVLKDCLLYLASDIRAKLGRHAEIHAFADTGPVADRSVAIRSGLGSQGKNTCVYVGEYGSWVVLGELVTDLELEPDPPAPLRICGECDECMKACPTGAICAPYTVDVPICLSQVTQKKGFIPHWLREKMGLRVYGCDTCQKSCPLNNSAKPGNVDDFYPTRGLGANPLLLPLLNMTQSEFKERVGPTTASWIGRTRLRRNVAVALGNLGDPEAIPALIQALADPEGVIRGHAAWALGKIGTPRSILALEKALGDERDERACEEIRRALCGSPRGE